MIKNIKKINSKLNDKLGNKWKDKKVNYIFFILFIKIKNSLLINSKK